MTNLYIGTSSIQGATTATITWNEYVEPVPEPEAENEDSTDAGALQNISYSICAVLAAIML